MTDSSTTENPTDTPTDTAIDAATDTAIDAATDTAIDMAADEPTAPAAPHVGTFAEHGVDARIAQSLAGAGITTPFPIQSMTLPVALSGHDIIGQAKTGTGKTLGFGVPLLQRTAVKGDPDYDALPDPGKPQALVIVPTRELATQVAGDLTTASRQYPARILTVYGGRAYEPQIDALNKGIDVVVGTPGRLLDLAQQRHLDLSNVMCVVLDEADEMLDLGFLPDVERLLGQTNPARQTMLFSATMPGPVVAMARSYMRQPTHIRAVDPTDDGATVAAITQYAYRTHALDKVEVLSRMLQANGRGLTIVFSRTKRTAASVAEQLTERGFAAASIHGDLGQGAREQALRAFRHGKVDVLVATDVAARGIDVEDVTHVVNYQCPEDEKTYLHRIGRTGRAGNTGVAVTFVDWDELPRWGLIDKALGLGFGEPVETYSSSPHLFEDLSIPAGTTGRLPRTQRTRAGLEAEQYEDLGEVGASKGRRPQKDGPRRDGSSRDGARKDGGRTDDGGRSRSRSAEASEVTEEQPTEETTERPRRNRQRRRTRSGQEVAAEATEASTDASAAAAASPDAAAPAEVPAQVETSESTEDGAPSRPRRRRRTRSTVTDTGSDTGSDDGAGNTGAPTEVPAAE